MWPGLLPYFCMAAGKRLAALETLSLEGNAVLTYGDFGSLAGACPNLRSLSLGRAPVVGPALEPLSRLQNLTCLKTAQVWAPQGFTGVAASLTCLTRISELHLCSNLREPGRLTLDTVLPLLHDLRGAPLRNLELALGPRVHNEWSAVRHLTSLAALTQLTSLDVDVTRGSAYVEVCVSGAAELSGLSSTTRLASLTLWGLVLDGAGVRLIAALPHLTELRAQALEPDYDMCTLLSSWQKLTLGCITAPQHLAWLPLSQLWRLRVACDRMNESIEWAPFTSASPDVLQAVGDAASVLSWAWIYRWTNVLKLRLDFDGSGGGATAGATAAEAACDAILAALAPLDERPRLQLRLGRGFGPSPRTIDVLLRHLPNLRFLSVDAAAPEFAAFAAAAATRLTALRVLTVGDVGGAVLESARAPLLAAATARAQAGLPLCFEIASGWTEEDLQACNAITEANKRGIDSGRVVFANRAVQALKVVEPELTWLSYEDWERGCQEPTM